MNKHEITDNDNNALLLYPQNDTPDLATVCITEIKKIQKIMLNKIEKKLIL